MTNYTWIYTNKGLEKLVNCQAGGAAIDFKSLAIGDGNGAYYDILQTQTALKHEVTRIDLLNVEKDSSDPTILNIEAVLPSDNYGYMIREIGLVDAAGDLLAVKLYPLLDKTDPTLGQLTEAYFYEKLVVANTANVTIIVSDTSCETPLEDDAGTIKLNIDETLTIKNNKLSVASVLSATNPISILNNVISLAFDNTLKVLNNKLSVVTEGLIPNLATRFAMNSGNVDASGNADILNAPGSGAVETVWQQPILTSELTLGTGTFSTYCVGVGNNNTSYLMFNNRASVDFNFNSGAYTDVYMYTSDATIFKGATILQGIGAYSMIANGEIFGSTDGGIYTSIGTFTGSTTNPTITFTVTNTTQYHYYRLRVYNSNPSYGGFILRIDLNMVLQAAVSTATACYFKVGGSYSNLALTYADKSTEILTSLATLSGMTTNGAYTILKEKGSSPVAILSSKVTQGKIFPSSPSNGDYHCLTATDLITYKRVSGAWVETQYVPLGTVKVSGNVITAVTTNPYNQNGYNVNMQSFLQSIAANGYCKLPNGLILQWGMFTTSPSGYTNITFPIAFPNALLSITDSIYADFNANLSIDFNMTLKTTTTIPCAAVTPAAAYYVISVCWFAVGY